MCPHPSPPPPAVEEPGVTIVPQPDLSGATEQMSPDEVQLRLVRKAEELKGDSSLTEVSSGTTSGGWVQCSSSGRLEAKKGQLASTTLS